MAQLKTIQEWVEEHFDFSIQDISLNGIQIENSGKIDKIIAAVDFSQNLLESTVGQSHVLFIVHHGWFWGKPFPLAGAKYKMLKEMFIRDSALLALHLPLDIHPKWGNNVMLAKRLGLSELNWFGSYKGQSILLSGEYENPINIEELSALFKKKIGDWLIVLSQGPQVIKKVGLCTGGGLFGIEQAKKHGCDVYITGDANHTSVELCRELEINLISGGHYNTEQFGVQALGESMSLVFNLPYEFIALPTHL